MRVVIAGGGIAGLTTAIVLTRRGIETSVFESAAADRPQGSGLMVSANALELFTRLGLYDAIRGAGREPQAMGVFSQTGRPVSVVDSRQWQERYGFRSIALHREALHSVLSGALPGEIVQANRRVVGFEQTRDRVAVRFDSGATEEADVLVGADGLHSAVRTALFGERQLRYSGQTSYRAIADHVVEAGPYADVLTEIWGHQGGQRFGFARIDECSTYWFTTRRALVGERDDSPEAAHRRLSAEFERYPDEVRELLRRTEPASLIRTDIQDFAPLARWHDGRVVLVGDAAHATTPNLGQGACQAIESGYVLATELAQRTVQDAFAKYQAVRWSRAELVTRMSWRFGKLVGMGGPLGRWLKFGLMPRLSTQRALRQMDAIFKLPY
jgi:2-polyprenyl-6-methoxyphenol hydroxylase-like FAD-dependent oxidoreductase